MCMVFNKRFDVLPKGAVYIGRPSKWGNPFSHLRSTEAKYRVKTRDEAIDKYEEYIYSNPELMEQARQELKGKDLVCWCKPHRCHGDILLEIANNLQ